MDGKQLLQVQRAIYYQALNTLSSSGVPHDLWPLVMDGASGHIYSDALTVMSAQASASHDEPSEEDDDGEHRAGD